MKTSRNDGFSLVEILVVVSLIAIALTFSVPSWNEAKSKRELVNASESLSVFLSAGRSLAIKHNTDVAVSLVYQNSTTWCIGLADADSACDCTVEDANRNNYCAVGGVPQILHANDFPRVGLDSHAADVPFVFDRIRGTLISSDMASPHFFNLISANGKIGLQVGVSATGTTFICNWLESANAPAYRVCDMEPGEPESPGYEGGLLVN